MSLAQVLPVLGCLSQVSTSLHSPHPHPAIHSEIFCLDHPERWTLAMMESEAENNEQLIPQPHTWQLSGLDPHHTADCGEGCYLVTSSCALINTQESGNQLMTQTVEIIIP